MVGKSENLLLESVQDPTASSMNKVDSAPHVTQLTCDSHTLEWIGENSVETVYRDIQSFIVRVREYRPFE